MLLTDLKQAWPQASFYRDDLAIEDLAAKLSQALIPGLVRPSCAESLTSEPLRLLLKGSNFQLKVWEALLRVPTACVISYGDLAQLSGYPKAARAVGSTLARNQVAYFIPCHRVIRETGEFGQYRWGTERKMALLGLEQAVQAVSWGSA